MSNYVSALPRQLLVLRRRYGFRPLSGMAMIGVSLGVLSLAPQPAGAQEIIDGGQTVTVPGDQNSPWNLGADNLIVGESGQGTLNIENGGIVLPFDLQIGVLDTALGTVTVSGAGSALSSTGLMTKIGIEGRGVVTISDGASLDAAGAMVLGELDGGDGTLTVTGDGSSVVVSQYMTLGDLGSGTLNIENGGSVTTGSLLTLGLGQFRNGVVLISGENSHLEAMQHALIGNAGNGLVIIEGGATMDVAQDLVLGNSLTGNGQVGINGPGAALTFGQAFVGYDGDGFVSVENGGSFGSAGHDLVIGMGVDGAGSIQVSDTGSTVAAHLVTVGEEGQALVNVTSGARLETGITTLGQQAGSKGEVRLSGPGAVWANTADDIYVGRFGEGIITAAAGAKIETISYVRLGTEASGLGGLTLSGEGTSLNAGVSVEIGKQGRGQVTVEDGATLTHGTDLLIGQAGGSMGMAIVSGDGSNWLGLGDATIGETGLGIMIVEDGASADIADHTVLGLAGGAGAMQVANGSFSTGTLVVGETGGGDLTVQDGGTVTVGNGAGIIDLAVQAGSSAIVSIGNGSSAGTLEASKLRFGAGNGSLWFAHTDGDYRFDPIIEGDADIEHDIGHTTLTADSSSFVGTTTIWGGTLSVDGILGGTIDIETGGTLGGSGMVGDVSVATGGAVAPGNSIGTLDVGNIVFDAGSQLLAEVDGQGNADLVNASGTATINGGNVSVSAFPDIALDTPYAIVSAAAGLTGNFDSAMFGANSIFVTATLTTDLNNAYVTLTQTTDFADVALTPNQKAAAAGIQSAAAGAAFAAIAGLGSAGEARAAFDAISGEIHASSKAALLEDSRFLREAAIDRLRTALAREAPVEAATGSFDQRAFWAQGFGSSGQWDGDGNAAGLERGLGGFLFGGDAAVSDWRLGLMAGVSHSGFEVGERASSGSATSYHLGAYAGTNINGLGIRVGGAYSLHDMQIDRVAAFSGFSETLSANYLAGTGQIFGEFDYGFDAGAARVEPFVNLAHVRLTTPGFSETGGSAALHAASATTDATYTTLGARAETGLTVGNGATVALRGMVGWRHAFTDATPEAALNFAGGDAFTVAGTPIAQDALVLEAGFDAALSATATFGIAYSGQLASGAQDHSLKARLGGAF